MDGSGALSTASVARKQSEDYMAGTQKRESFAKALKERIERERGNGADKEKQGKGGEVRGKKAAQGIDERQAELDRQASLSRLAHREINELVAQREKRLRTLKDERIQIAQMQERWQLGGSRDGSGDALGGGGESDACAKEEGHGKDWKRAERKKRVAKVRARMEVVNEVNSEAFGNLPSKNSQDEVIAGDEKKRRGGQVNDASEDDDGVGVDKPTETVPGYGFTVFSFKDAGDRKKEAARELCRHHFDSKKKRDGSLQVMKRNLSKLGRKKEGVRRLSREEQVVVEQDDAWAAALNRSEGDRKTDVNMEVLRKKVKKKERKKEKSRREWQERLEGLELNKQQRQQERKERMRARALGLPLGEKTPALSTHQIGKAMEWERRIQSGKAKKVAGNRAGDTRKQRPGFEGSKTGFVV